ncbi:MAG: hypothetical protein ACD_20C00276G0001, partial [uncultured bacterium]
MGNNSTHFIFDGTKVVISSDLQPIVIFLQGIEEEVESLLNFENQIESIRQHYAEIIELLKKLTVDRKEALRDLNFKFSEDPFIIIEKLKLNRPVRPEMIVLFAYLETLFCLNIAYENKTSDKNAIIKQAMDQNNIRSFISKFCLDEKNDWIQKNHDRAKRIS